MSQGYDYDVALSFAGEDRVYVEEVANILHALGGKVFYDRYEETELWGKDLYTHLDDVYQHKAKFCVMFISKHYAEKLWTNHERQSAQMRALASKQEYILPVRFDDTEIPGDRKTIAYIDLKQKTPTELAYLIAKKVGISTEIDEMLKYLRDYYQDHCHIELKGEAITFDCPSEDWYGEFPVRLLLEMYRLNMLFEMFIYLNIVPE
jgi:hypothetical protein